MPDMDGYETIREIRARPEMGDLPVVAVTAKAMKGDRQKCIQAGASDYVSKPVDIDHLVSVLRVSIFSLRTLSLITICRGIQCVSSNVLVALTGLGSNRSGF